MKRAVTFLVGAVALATLCVGSGQTRPAEAATRCAPVWSPVSSPRTADGVLWAVAGRTDTDVWAVGAVHSTPEAWGDASLSEPLIEHWDGGSWTVASAPASQGQLLDVATSPSGEAWAVGSVDGSSTRGGKGIGVQPLLEHWDGSAWSLTRLAWPLDLAAVSAPTSRNVWVVGNRDREASVLHLGPDGWRRVGVFVRHWNGKRWIASTDPPVANDNAETIALRAGAEVWATSSPTNYFSTGGTSDLVRLTTRGWSASALPKDTILAAITPDMRLGLWAVGFTGIGTVTDSTVAFPLHTNPVIRRYGC